MVNLQALRIVGIDPGIDGAIAILDAESYRVINVHDIPSTPKVHGKGREINAYALYEIYKSFAGHPVVLEQVGAMPQDARTAAFSFGETFGVIKALTSVVGSQLIMTKPTTWKKHFGLIKKDKDASRTLAIQLFPEIRQELSRKKDKDRAEAALIALHHLKTYRS